MTDDQTFLTKLQQNLNLLYEREAKYSGNAPRELLNQIADHQEAITLTEQALTGHLTESEWRNALYPLLIAIQTRSDDETTSTVSIGDIGGSIQDSTIAGRDVNQITVNVINLLGQEAADSSSESEPFIRSLKDLILKQVATIDPRTAQRYPQNPTGYTDPLRDALTELLETDRGLAARLDALLEQYEQAQRSGSGSQITLSGTGNVLYGQGNIGVTNTGPGVAIGQARDVYLQPPPTDPIQTRRQEARQRYLAALRRHCQVLPLAALGGEEGADEDLSLDQVYIDLDTTHRIPLTEAEKAKRQNRQTDLGLEREAEERILTALEAAAQTPRLALLGDPGAGKSTFVRKLIGWQAAALLGEGQSPPGCTASLLPILLTLRDLAPRLAGLNLASLSGKARQHIDHRKEDVFPLQAELEQLGALIAKKQGRLARLLELYLDEALDKGTYHEQKRGLELSLNELNARRQEVSEKIAAATLTEDKKALIHLYAEKVRKGLLLADKPENFEVNACPS